jgi:hypothetical protein
MEHSNEMPNQHPVNSVFKTPRQYPISRFFDVPDSAKPFHRALTTWAHSVEFELDPSAPPDGNSWIYTCGKDHTSDFPPMGPVLGLHIWYGEDGTLSWRFSCPIGKLDDERVGAGNVQRTIAAEAILDSTFVSFAVELEMAKAAALTVIKAVDYL